MRLFFLHSLQTAEGGAGLPGDPAEAGAIVLHPTAEPLDPSQVDRLGDKEYLAQFLSAPSARAFLQEHCFPPSSYGLGTAQLLPRLDWYSSTKRYPVVAFVATTPTQYSANLINAALAQDAFSRVYSGLQMFVGSSALVLHLSLPEPDSPAALSLLFYLFSVANFVCLIHSRRMLFLLLLLFSR